MSTKISDNSGIISALLSPLLSAVATVLFAGATRYIEPLIAATLSSILGAIILILISIRKSEEISVGRLKGSWRLVLSLAFWRILLGSSIFAIGLKNSDAIKAVFFTKIEPYFVIAWGWILFKERVSSREIFLLLVHLGGAFLVSTGGDFTHFGKAQIGDLLIILSMCISGFSYFKARSLSGAVGSRLAAISSELIGGIIAIPFAILFSAPQRFDAIPIQGWQYLFLNIFLFNVLALPLWFYALRSVKGWIVSAVRAIGPLVGAPAAYFLLGEHLNLMQLVGGVFVVATSAIIAREHWSATKKSSV